MSDEQPLFSVQRTTRLGDKRLDVLDVTLDRILDEAGMGRGLFVGRCSPRIMVARVARLVGNSAPLPAVVTPWSYEACEDIGDTLARSGVPFWQAKRGTTSQPKPAAGPVMVSVPEKLYLVDPCVRKGVFRPYIIHVLDRNGLVIQRQSSADGRQTCRAWNVGRFKAVCQAQGKMPYVIIWSTEGCACCPSSHLCEMMGVEAWLWADWGSVRLAL